MKRVYFKNGLEKAINEETAQILQTRILEGCAKFQCFYDSDELMVEIINIDEVVYIGEN